MLRYHFADEAEQIQQLMKPIPANRDTDTPEQPGLSETAAAFAVLGVDIDALGVVVGRQWGLGDDVMHMARRLPADAPVRKPDSDAEVLRQTASAAIEAVDAVATLGGARAVSAINQIALRYARALNINARDVNDALQAARETLRKGTPTPASTRTIPPEAPTEAEPAPVAR
jgi:non-specific serine/threonine protein kinase